MPPQTATCTAAAPGTCASQGHNNQQQQHQHLRALPSATYSNSSRTQKRPQGRWHTIHYTHLHVKSTRPQLISAPTTTLRSPVGNLVALSLTSPSHPWGRVDTPTHAVYVGDQATDTFCVPCTQLPHCWQSKCLQTTIWHHGPTAPGLKQHTAARAGSTTRVSPSLNECRESCWSTEQVQYRASLGG